MAKYTNRAKRKLFFKKVMNNFKRMRSLPSSDTTNTMTLDDIILEKIKECLDFTLAYGEIYHLNIRYYVKNKSKYHPSLEEEYRNYFGVDPTDNEIDDLFKALTLFTVEHYISNYKDLNINIDEDENGKFFEIVYIK